MSDNLIPLKAARRRRPPPGGGAPKGCPVAALGHQNGVFVFLSTRGEVRRLSSKELCSRPGLASLFDGDMAWLQAHHPKTVVRRHKVAGETIEETEVTGISVAEAGESFMRMAAEAGIFGDHIVVRLPGIWRDQAGAPAVHCGDVVVIGGKTHIAGQTLEGQVWAAQPATPRPGPPCAVRVGADLQQDLQRLWTFKQGGGAIVLLGLLGAGFLGIAARWRPNAFLHGEPGSGKSLLIDALAACCPLHSYTNNASEAGVASAMNGHAMPVFIDESSDRANQGGAEMLMDLVLAASSGDGTKALRGKADGGYRTIEMAGVVLYGSVTPPALQPQHLARITLVELLKPAAGEDHRVAMEDLIVAAREHGPGLWGRALAGFERWRAAFGMFRQELGVAGCAAREMDQLGALLAGWWILTRDGVPDAAGAEWGVAAVGDFVRRADDVAEDGGPRRAVQLLLAATVQYDGTTRQEQVGTLLTRALGSTDEEVDAEFAARVLGRHGVRPVRPCKRLWTWGELYPRGPKGWVRRHEPEAAPVNDLCHCAHCLDYQRRPAPRVSDDGGVWLLPAAVAPLFRGRRGLDDDRWQFEILRIPRTVRSKRNVRVGGVAGKAIWLPRREIEQLKDGDL